MVTFTPPPCGSGTTVRVWLRGPGPGTYFDLATFSFQTPTSGLLCAELLWANAEPTVASDRASRLAKTKIRFMSVSPSARTFGGPLADSLQPRDRRARFDCVQHALGRHRYLAQ